MTNYEQSVSFYKQVPNEVWETVFSFCERKELFNLLTVCSQFFPMVAKRLWSQHCMYFYQKKDLERSKDFRVRLLLEPNLRSTRLFSAPSLPYLNYITELELGGPHNPKSQMLMLKNVPNCQRLTIYWSNELSSSLLDTTNVVPFLTHLCIIPGVFVSYDVDETTKDLQAILKARAATLKTLHINTDLFCISQLLLTIVSDTQLIEFDNTFNEHFDCDNESMHVLSKSLFPSSSSLHRLSINLETLHTPLELDFFHWIHSSPNLTTLELTLKQYRPLYGSKGISNHFLHFLNTFPSSTPLKKLVMWYFYCDPDLDNPPNEIDKSPMELNLSLETLEFEFNMYVKRISYNLLNLMLDKFPRLKNLRVIGDPCPRDETVYNQGTVDEHQSFLNRLATFQLTKLLITLPNSIQHFLLPTLKCMTSLREIEITLNLGLLYSFIIELPHLTRLIFRPTEYTRNLKVLIDKKPIPLIPYETHYDQYYYIFNKVHLDLIRNAPLESVSFES